MSETSKPRCTETVPDGSRWPRYVPCSKPVKVERGGKHYCTVHDPERVSPSELRYRAGVAKTAEIEAEAKALAARLGVQGGANYISYAKAGQPTRSRDLVLSFDAVEQLLKELGR